MNVKPIKRNFKNVVYNFTDAQVKVREATSNDPWGPSSSLMAEVADMTHNPASFAEIMQMLWKRLNDSGRNWRHVYKALILLEYIIKTGSDRVASQCRDNIYVIQTLRDFQYYDKELNKDHGANVREKAKHLCQLLTEEDKLKAERAKALKTRERFQWQRGLISTTGAGSLDHLGIDAPSTYPRANNDTTRDQQPISSSSFSSNSSSGPAAGASGGAATAAELRNARPRTAEEEEIQLQLALAMSKEDADKEEQLRRNDDMRLRMALNESQQEQGSHGAESGGAFDESLIGMVDQPYETRNTNGTTSSDPWAPGASSNSTSGMPFITPPPSASNAGNAATSQRSATYIASSSNANDLSMLQTELPSNMQDNHSAAAASILDAFSTVPSHRPPAAAGGIYPYLNTQSSMGGIAVNPYMAGGGRSAPVEDDAWSVRSPASAAVMMNSRPSFAPAPATNQFGGIGGSTMHASATGGPMMGTSTSLLDDGLDGLMPQSIGASHTGPGGASGFPPSWSPQKRALAATGAAGVGAKSKEVEQFLGGHSALVDLDALLAPTSSLPKPTFGGGGGTSSAFMPSGAGVSSPFNTTVGGGAFAPQRSTSPSMAGGGGGSNNPFHNAMPLSMSMNDQIRSKQQQVLPSTSGWQPPSAGGGWDNNGVGGGNESMLMPQQAGGLLQPQLLQPSMSMNINKPSATGGGYDVFQPQQQQQPAAAANASYNPFL